MNIPEFLFVYLFGALSYGGLEMLWRGRTHWTMLLLGGACFLCIYLISVRARAPLPVRWALCALTVTALEFLCGCIVNLYLGWDVWDYSKIPGNLLGQICPRYTLYWFFLSIPCSALSAALRRFVFEKAH